MKEFTFIQLMEHTLWATETYTIEAETYEKAKEEFLKSISIGDEFKYSNSDFFYHLEDTLDTGYYELQDEEGNVIRKEQR